MPSSAQVNIDSSDFTKLGVNLNTIVEELQATTSHAMLEAAETIVVPAAKRNIAPFSDTTPGTIHAVPVDTEIVSVEAGTLSSPLPALLERGNLGASESLRTFRHPVWGQMESNWVEQPKHPYLKPAVEETLPVVLLTISEDMIRVVEVEINEGGEE